MARNGMEALKHACLTMRRKADHRGHPEKTGTFAKKRAPSKKRKQRRPTNRAQGDGGAANKLLVQFAGKQGQQTNQVGAKKHSKRPEYPLELEGLSCRPAYRHDPHMFYCLRVINRRKQKITAVPPV